MEARPRSAGGGDVPPSVAGVKRAASDMLPSLLPAFEPASSPPLPRPAKRVARESPPKATVWTYGEKRATYPTPVPTSSTGLVSSSPPARVPRRPGGLQRTASSLSERAPLASVPTIELDASGEETLMGRSGKSSTYQLSTNKLISRVHVRAAYVPADPPNPPKVELMCCGWNGVKIHCQGKAWELGKGDTFTSESQDADIMIDVQDARVLLQWPKATGKAHTPAATDSGPEDENTPSRGGQGIVRRATFPSPLRQRARMHSPVSPTPVVSDSLTGTVNGILGVDTHAPIQIYEDEPGAEDVEEPLPTQDPTQSTQRLTQPLGARLSTSPANHVDDQGSDGEDADEENDPLVHSFQATGENLLSRLASVRAGASPEQLRRGSELPAYVTEPPDVNDPTISPIVNHVINQLAFARVASTPLSTIRSHLPESLQGKAPLAMLQAIIDMTDCIGKVEREGKDAAGKALEPEYYYVPEQDLDTSRRAAVVEGLQKPGLRSCRKSHKQYYWRKPR